MLAAVPSPQKYPQLQLLPLDRIHKDPLTQIRITELDPSHLQDLQATLDDALANFDGDIIDFPESDAYPFEPISIVLQGDRHLLADGWHRERVCQRAGLAAMPAKIETGSLSHAIARACNANAKHGLKLSKRDKRNAVLRLAQILEREVRNGERQAVPSGTAIARQCGVAQSFVNAQLRELTTSGSLDRDLWARRQRSHDRPYTAPSFNPDDRGPANYWEREYNRALRDENPIATQRAIANLKALGIEPDPIPLPGKPSIAPTATDRPQRRPNRKNTGGSSLSLKPSDTIQQDCNDSPTATLVANLKQHVPIAGTILDPCNRDGAIARCFDNCTTYDLFSNHIHTNPASWSFWETHANFDWIVSQPPSQLATHILQLAHERARIGVAFLLPLAYLEPREDRADWLATHPIAHLLPSTSQDTEDATTWFVWLKENAHTQIHYIRNSK